MATNIYVLKLEGGRYYVGKTADTTKRYQEHLAGNGSAWTRKYKPVSLERVITNASPFDEDKITKEYMSKYGIGKVRGGAYVTEDLEDFQEEALRREIWGAGNRCTLCGRSGHFIKDCYATTDVEGNEIYSEGESEYDSDSSSEAQVQFSQRKSIIKPLQSYTSVQVQKKVVAKKLQPVYTTPIAKKNIQKKSYESQENTCFRCGRAGHFANDCYARSHVRGYTLDSDSEDY